MTAEAAVNAAMPTYEVAVRTRATAVAPPPSPSAALPPPLPPAPPVAPPTPLPPTGANVLSNRNNVAVMNANLCAMGLKTYCYGG